MFEAVRVTEHVFWVGAIDWGMRDFHGYLTRYGTTYNAYLVLGEKITLIDTVRAQFAEELLERISSVVAPEKISYVVSNHAEKDHSGGLLQVAEVVRPEKIFASKMGVKNLAAHYHDLAGKFTVEAVADGGRLDLGGGLELEFMETRMLHWPDSMFSYLAGEGVLFCQDAFGMHLASGERFADELAAALLEQEAAKYFANILLPFSPLVLKLLQKVAGKGWRVEVLAPDHGPIWRQDIGRILELYRRWAGGEKSPKVVVVYDTMWQSTAAMAEAIVEGVAGTGTSVRLLPLKSCHRSDAVTEVLEAGALVVGSPTINKGIFPTVADFLAYLEGLRPQRLLGAAFGSYGWSGEAVGKLEEWLRRIGVELVAEGIRANFVPDGQVLEKCSALGRLLGERLKKSG